MKKRKNNETLSQSMWDPFKRFIDLSPVKGMSTEEARKHIKQQIKNIEKN